MFEVDSYETSNTQPQINNFTVMFWAFSWGDKSDILLGLKGRWWLMIQHLVHSTEFQQNSNLTAQEENELWGFTQWLEEAQNIEIII